MRVIAGDARGRRLQAPRGDRTRPTGDRVREALFSSVAEQVPGATVLDLYAGSGALGIEALSRGAAFAVFVDTDRAALRAIDANLTALRLHARARVAAVDAGRFCREPGRQGTGRVAFDLVLCDPPYAEGLPAVLGHIAALDRAGGVRPGAVVVVERDRRDPGLAHPVPPPLVLLRDRTYGDTVLRYLRRPPDEPPEEPPCP